MNEALKRSQAGGAGSSHRSHNPKVWRDRSTRWLRRGRRWDEAQFGEFLPQPLQFDRGFAFVRDSYAAGKKVSVIGEHVDALATSGDADVELLTIHGAEGPRGGDQQHLVHGLALGRM